MTLAHRALTARLDRAGIDTGAERSGTLSARRPPAGDAGFEGDVPEFIPSTAHGLR